MTVGKNQKLKLLYLLKILLEMTDENHSLTTRQIVEQLKNYGISEERKTVYTDIEILQDFGIDIIKNLVGNTCHYHIGNREFELAELKLLVDLIQSSKFMTDAKSHELIKKLELLTSRHEARQLQRQVYISGRVKSQNESIYYNVDKIHTAINKNVQIQYWYYQWNVDKTKELRHNGKKYCVSPWALAWDNENYYMIAYDSEAKEIKHYRVDKMLRMELTQHPREGKKQFSDFNIAAYMKKTFGMYHGVEKMVRLKVKNDLAGVIIDRFGMDIPFIKRDPDYFETCVEVAVSDIFLGWIIALGDGIEIIGPSDVRNMIKGIGQRIIGMYDESN